MAPAMDSRPGTSSGRRGDNLAAVASRLNTPMYVSDRAMPPEEETIRNIESKLKIGISAQTEESFVMNTCGSDGLCTDTHFPPGPSSLYPDPTQLPATAIDAITWRRLAGAMYVPSGKTPKFLQGSMQNGQFLGALAGVALKQDLLLDLIVSDDHAQQGAYTFQFYKHGCWHQVVVDNFLPCLDDPDEQRLAFACSSNAGELWPSLLEKAYAKVHGSYYALEGGSVGDVLVDLTGGVVSKFKLQKQDEESKKRTAALWDQLRAALDAGSIVVSSAKVKGDAGGGPNGLQYGKLYSIMDAQMVDQGPMLLRLHCPWSTGHWTGMWSNGSREWSLPVMHPHMQYFAPTLEDDATFWISLEDFAAFFDRLHICRLFPTSWHQLTLHCGWQGPSAGGPYFTNLGDKDGEPVMGPSSTWCCNPQFRITVRKACDVIVCLGQQDPRVLNKRHVRKQMRKQSIGMQVLRLPLSSFGRRWEVRGNELAQEVSLTAMREASASFRAEPDSAYIIVPYSGRAGDEGAFVLRAFSSAPLEMEQLPSPLSLVLGGHWAGHLAGGPKTASTFGSNPQYMISCQQKTQVVLSASRLDIRYAILKPAYKAEQCVGLMLLQPDKTGPEGGLGRCTAVRSASQVLGEFGFESMDEAVAMFMLEPETPYVVVPCLASAGVEAPFELRIMSGVPVELVPLPEVKCMVMKGGWGPESSGGCDLHPVWKRNPRYLLVLKERTKAKITLTRLGKNLKQMASVDDMIGFYILKASEPTGEIKGDLRRAIVYETTFVTTPDNSAEQSLVPDVQYVIMPCTYSPGRHGRFSLAVTCTVDFDLVEL